MSQPPLSIHIKSWKINSARSFLFAIRAASSDTRGQNLDGRIASIVGECKNVLARVEQIGRGEAGRIELGLWERQCGDGCARLCGDSLEKS